MKWDGYVAGGAEKLSRGLGKKAFYYLMLVASLGVLLGASVKWHG